MVDSKQLKMVVSLSVTNLSKILMTVMKMRMEMMVLKKTRKSREEWKMIAVVVSFHKIPIDKIYKQIFSFR